MKSTRMVCSLILLSSHILLDAASTAGAGQITQQRYDRKFLKTQLVALENESLQSIASATHLKAVVREIDHFKGRLATLNYIDGSEKFVTNNAAQPVAGREIEDERFEGGKRIVGIRFPKDALFARYTQSNDAANAEKIALMSALAEKLFTNANLRPEAAYYVRAAIEGFKVAELDEDVDAFVYEARRPEPQTEGEALARQKEQLQLTRNEILVANAFSGYTLPQEIRFAGAMRLAEVLQAVQDPSSESSDQTVQNSTPAPSGLGSYLLSLFSSSQPTEPSPVIKKTLEPKEVTNFLALQEEMLEITDIPTKMTRIQEWKNQLDTIHGHAVAYLTSLLDVDRETKEARTFTANIRDLQHTLRHLNELRMLQANMQQDIPSSMHQPSSSSSSSFDS